MVVYRAADIRSITFDKPFAPPLEASETGEDEPSSAVLLGLVLPSLQSILLPREQGKE